MSDTIFNSILLALFDLFLIVVLWNAIEPHPTLWNLFCGVGVVYAVGLLYEHLGFIADRS
jgi:hypothetical protein